eukprot:gene1542-biopygen1294
MPTDIHGAVPNRAPWVGSRNTTKQTTHDIPQNKHWHGIVWRGMVCIENHSGAELLAGYGVEANGAELVEVVLRQRWRPDCPCRGDCDRERGPEPQPPKGIRQHPEPTPNPSFSRSHR